MKGLVVVLVSLVVGFNSWASELFVKYDSPAEHYASIHQQKIYNIKNIYRFHDVLAGNVQLKIFNKATNALVVDVFVNVSHNERVAIEFDVAGRMTNLIRIPINEENWYTSTELNSNFVNPQVNGNTANPTNINGYYQPVNETIYQTFLNSIKGEINDNNKLRSAKSFVKQNYLSSEQIAGIAKELNFDKNRLEFAKYAYTYCVNKGNYFLLKDVFSFNSNYNTLLKYLEGK